MTSDAASLDTSRIDYLLGDARLHDTKVVMAGLGSGGAVVLERLGMAGVGRWSLYDPDVLESVNLVKHPGRRSDLGKRKTEIARNWLLDRNPRCTIDREGGDVVADQDFRQEIATADVVVCAVDTPAARSFINEVCVQERKPCIVGSVFRTGIGGEVYAYLPGETGCHSCKSRYSLEHGQDIENWLDVTDEENQRMYGLGDADFVASGMAVDISIVASFHAHYIMALLAGGGSPYITTPSFNWFTVSLRRVEGLFGAMYATSRTRFRPQKDCYLDCGKP